MAERAKNNYDNEFVSPKLDVIFKMMFGDKNNTDLLRSLLKTFLGIDEDGEYILGNTEITPAEIKGKFVRLDLRIVKGKKSIDIEVQINNDRNFKRRSLYYWSQLNASLIKEGEEYEPDKLEGKSAHSLNIMDFVLFPEDEHFFNMCYVQNTYHTIDFGDMMQMAYVELPKLKIVTPEQVESDDRVAWAAFFKARNEEEINMLGNATQNTDVRKAVTIIREYNADEEIREKARQRWDTIFRERDIISAERAAAKAEGKAEGRAEGRAETKAEDRENFIKGLRKSGIPEERIPEILKNCDLEEL